MITTTTTTTEVAFDAKQWRELYHIDSARLQLARDRQASVWSGRKPDAWPIIMSDKLTPKQEQTPNPNFAEAFHDPSMMLCQQMRPACALANAQADGVPSIRANMGTATLLACFGLEQEVIPDQMPWLQQHLTLEQARQLTVDDIHMQGSFAKALDFIRFYRQTMGQRMPVYCVDTQGPFDLAHLLVGDEIFYVMYDDPGLTHHIMELCTALYIRCTEEVKRVAGEAISEMVHSNSLFIPNAGVRICEDTTTLLGRDLIEEFALPYTRRAAAHFGGAWIHYCGRSDTLAEMFCETPEIVGLNYGIVPGKEKDFEFDREMQRIAAGGKVYYGTWPRGADESGRNYLRRLHRYASNGALIAQGDPARGGNDGFATTADALDFWYAL